MDKFDWENALQVLFGLVAGWLIKIFVDVIKNKSAIEAINDKFRSQNEFIKEQLNNAVHKNDREVDYLERRINVVVKESTIMLKKIDRACDESLSSLNSAISRVNHCESELSRFGELLESIIEKNERIKEIEKILKKITDGIEHHSCAKIEQDN